MSSSELTRRTSEQSSDVHADTSRGRTVASQPAPSAGTRPLGSSLRRSPRSSSRVTTQSEPSEETQESRCSSRWSVSEEPGVCSAASRRSESSVPSTKLRMPRVASMRIWVEAMMRWLEKTDSGGIMMLTRSGAKTS